MDKSGLHIKRKRAKKMILTLKSLFPNPALLKYGSNWELLVSVILSAQCTDKMVNKVTAMLFKKYKRLDDYANAGLREFERDIKSIGLYRNKARNIILAARKIRDEFNGRVPNTMEELLTIPGVGRKTANVVLSKAYGVIEGIAVDTHVKRFAQRFGLTHSADPRQIEKDLMRIIPKKDWAIATNLFIEYGRKICPARKHNCKEHPLTRIYPRAAEIWPVRRG